MSESLDQEIRTLRARFWSSQDPEGRAFAPLAEAYRQLGELDEATALVRDGLDRLPDFATGHLVASRVARDRGVEAVDGVVPQDTVIVRARRRARYAVPARKAATTPRSRRSNFTDRLAFERL